MFGPRRGYDAIGEPSVSNADKPRVQPVKVDPKVWMSASRGVATPSLHSNASSPGEEVVGAFFSDFELFRTTSGPSRRVRETAVASMASSRDSAAATPSS